MAKDIEQILDDLVVPEMEYEPKYDIGKTKSKKRKSTCDTVVTVDQVPEVVLPKTKAEVYREAKGRLTQKTSAVSRTSDVKRVGKSKELKTVELEIAAVSQSGSTECERKTRRTEMHIRPLSEPIWVGGQDELVPFAWRMPLISDLSRPSKIYKQVIREARELMLPAPRDK